MILSGVSDIAELEVSASVSDGQHLDEGLISRLLNLFRNLWGVFIRYLLTSYEQEFDKLLPSYCFHLQ